MIRLLKKEARYALHKVYLFIKKKNYHPLLLNVNLWVGRALVSFLGLPDFSLSGILSLMDVVL